MRATPDPRPGPASSPGAFFRAFGGRKNALFFLLGLASGFPLGYAWFNISSLLGVRSADSTLTFDLLPLWVLYTAITVVPLVAFLIAPFLDRGPAPGLRRWGHRRSWVAAALICALVPAILVFAASLVLPPGAMPSIEGILYAQSAVAIPITAVMMVAVDAIRIELAPGRAQAIAYASQFAGALLGAVIVSVLIRLGMVTPTPLLLGLIVVQLAVGLFAVGRLPEPDPPSVAPAPIARSPLTEAAWFLRPVEFVWRALTQPWVAFFARHGGAAPFLLAAIALYAIAGSATLALSAAVLSTELAAIKDEARLERIQAAMGAVSSFGVAFYVIGGLIGAVIAVRTAPARAFILLQQAIIALIVFVVLIKLALGATPETALALSVLRTILYGAALVVYTAVAARLTARPHTAGQFYLLSIVLTLFWLSNEAISAIDRQFGSIALAGGIFVCAIAAIACMHMGGRIAQQRHLRPRPAASAGPAG